MKLFLYTVSMLVAAACRPALKNPSSRDESLVSFELLFSTKVGPTSFALTSPSLEVDILTREVQDGLLTYAEIVAINKFSDAEAKAYIQRKLYRGGMVEPEDKSSVVDRPPFRVYVAGHGAPGSGQIQTGAGERASVGMIARIIRLAAPPNERLEIKLISCTGGVCVPGTVYGTWKSMGQQLADEVDKTHPDTTVLAATGLVMRSDHSIWDDSGKKRFISREDGSVFVEENRPLSWLSLRPGQQPNDVDPLLTERASLELENWKFSSKTGLTPNDVWKRQQNRARIVDINEILAKNVASQPAPTKGVVTTAPPAVNPVAAEPEPLPDIRRRSPSPRRQ